MVTTPTQLIAIRRGKIQQLVEAGYTTPQIRQELNERTDIIVSDLRALKLQAAKVRPESRHAARNDTLESQIRPLAAQGVKRSAIAKELGISYTLLCTLMTERGIPKPARTPEHGTLREYRNRDCRCAPCTAANTAEIARARQARKARLSPDSSAHGTVSGYNNHLCRCLPCTEAASAFNIAYRDAPAVRTRRKWTPEEDQAILDYRHTAKELALTLGRPVPSITSRRTKLRKDGAIPATTRRTGGGLYDRDQQAEAARIATERKAAALLAEAAEGRRDALRTLVMRGLSRAQLMAALGVEYETLKSDLQLLGLTPSRTGVPAVTTVTGMNAPRTVRVPRTRALPLAS